LLGLLWLLLLLHLRLLLLLLYLLLLCRLLHLLNLLQHGWIHYRHSATAKRLHNRRVYDRHWNTRSAATKGLHGLHVSLHVLVVLRHKLG
jgi:hypothetical protein